MSITKNSLLKKISLYDLILSLIIYFSIFLVIILQQNSDRWLFWQIIILISYFVLVNLVYLLAFKKVKKLIICILILIITYVLVYTFAFVEFFSSGITQNLFLILYYLTPLIYPCLHLFSAFQNYLKN